MLAVAQAAEEGIFVVARPAADHHAIHRQRKHREDEQHADVQLGDAEMPLVRDGAGILTRRSQSAGSEWASRPERVILPHARPKAAPRSR